MGNLESEEPGDEKPMFEIAIVQQATADRERVRRILEFVEHERRRDIEAGQEHE